MLLKGKTAVITGSNRGIGKATLEAFARHGADVWACTRKPDPAFAEYAAGLAKETGVSVTPLHFDLADPAQVKEGGKAIASSQKPVDVLVNNAGAIFTALFQMTSPEKMKELFEVNFFAPMAFTQYVAKVMMRQRRGSIIHVSSSAAIEGNEGRTAYASSKAALLTATKVQARELGPAGIRVNAIAPGLTQTDMMTGSTPADALTATVQRLSLKRVARPEEIAGAALFLASDLSSYMTGQVLRVDGGM